MKRVMLQVYVQNSIEAAEFYQQAFDSPLENVVRNEDGSYIHAEIKIGPCVLSLSESKDSKIAGDTMQYCLHYGEGNEEAIKNAYNTLSEGGQVNHPLEPCFYSPLMTDLVDKFGVRWCLFV